MFIAKNLNLNGLQLSGTEAITPRTIKFCEKQGMQVTQQNGMVKIDGNFSLNKTEVEQFLSDKTKYLARP